MEVESVDQTKSLSRIGYFVFGTGVLYYCFAYLLRIYPSVIGTQLMQQYSITAQGLGLLTSFYYFAYAPMQLPVGIAVDKIGPRRSLMFACLIGISGTLLFSQTETFSVALLGRFLIGFGAAFAYVTALKIASVWLPKKYFATATGAITGFGMVSAALTVNSLTGIIHKYSYYNAMLVPTVVGLVMLVLIFLFVRDHDTRRRDLEETHAVSFKQLRHFLSLIMRNKQMWLIGVVGAVLYLPASVFLDQWAIPYLETAHHLSKYQAAYAVSVMLGGWIISSFLTGAYSDAIQSRKQPLILGTIGALITSIVLLYVPNLSVNSVFVLMFIFGVFNGPHPLCFTLSKEINNPNLAGTAVAFANFVIMMGGFIFQPLVGKFLYALSDGSTDAITGVAVYTANEYTTALSVMPIGLVFGLVCLYYIQETAPSRAGHQEKAHQHKPSTP